MRVRSCGPLFARSSGMFFSPRSKFNATSFAEFHLMGRRGTFPNIMTGFEFRAGLLWCVFRQTGSETGRAPACIQGRRRRGPPYCPITHWKVPTGIETDTQSLQAAWKATLKVKCPHCSEVHQISVRETYINGATGCYRQPVGHLGQVAWVGY